MSNNDSDNVTVTPAAAIKRLKAAVSSAVGEVDRLRGEVARMEAQGDELEGIKTRYRGNAGRLELMHHLVVRFCLRPR